MKREVLEDLIQERFGDHFKIPEEIVPSEELYHLLSHCSHRAYSDKPIQDSILKFLYYCALSAPSKSDLQQTDIIHIQNPEKRRKIEQLIPSMSWIEQAPVFLIFCGNNRRIRQICKHQNKQFANDHVDSFMNAAVDAGIVMMNFIRAAEAIDLVCCPISVIRNHAEKINEITNLPEFVFPFAGLAVGYSQAKAHISPKLPTQITTHKDTFQEAELIEALEQYDKYRQERKEFVNQRYVKEYGITPNYSWSEDKARQYSKPERANFGTYLIKKGFKLS